MDPDRQISRPTKPLSLQRPTFSFQTASNRNIYSIPQRGASCPSRLEDFEASRRSRVGVSNSQVEVRTHQKRADLRLHISLLSQYCIYSTINSSRCSVQLSQAEPVQKLCRVCTPSVLHAKQISPIIFHKEARR